MADFIFRVDSTLNDEQKKHIAHAIQGAVMTELAKLDLGAPQKGTGSGHHALALAPNYAYTSILNWYGGILAAELKAIEEASNSTFTVQTAAGVGAQTASAKKS